MIYWKDVKMSLLKHCPEGSENWTLKEIILYLNKEERLSMKRIAAMTGGRCGRTSLCLKMKEIREKS